MNNKIKSTGVFCLIDDYDELYVQLQNTFRESDLMIFAERTAGHEYLQWELPGDGWVTIADGDPIMAQEVKKELERRSQLLRVRFGDNQSMADKLLTVPDDSYIFYKPDASGKLVIILTAWGYRYPERIESTGTFGVFEDQVPKEHVTLQVVYADKPLGGKQLTLNGFTRTTDSNGMLDVGDLPIGYQFDVEVDGQSCRFIVVEGKEKLVFDVTVYTDLKVKALRDGQPYASASVIVNYWGRQRQLMTDAEGNASTQLPLPLEEQMCRVSIDEMLQQKPLSKDCTFFLFEFETPQQQAEAEVKVSREGMPCLGVPVQLNYGLESVNLITDDKGRALATMSLSEGMMCEVLVESQSQQKPLSEGLTTFVFELEAKKVDDVKTDDNAGEKGEDTSINEPGRKNKLAIVLYGLLIAALVAATYVLSHEILI